MYTTEKFELGFFSKAFDLGEGKKEVVVYMPWSVKAEIEELSLDDNAFVKPMKRKKKLLAYGDSITHGYDALNPRNKYITRFADAIHFEEYNKGIGGEVFFPELADLKQPFTPDLITVAYGTNDWAKKDKETFDKNCKSFYEKLARNYPTTPILALTPIWRKEINTVKTEFGDFGDVEKGIREFVKDIENITVVSCFDFIPKEEKYFADLRLHPNDRGFQIYFENLYEKVRGII